MEYTVDQIKNLLQNNDIAVNRAMVALYNEQTESEKSCNQTNESNGRGFSYRTAPKGTYYAKWVLSGKSLSGYHLDNARKIALFHAKQLTNLANENLQKKKQQQENKSIVPAYSIAIVNDNNELING